MGGWNCHEAKQRRLGGARDTFRNASLTSRCLIIPFRNRFSIRSRLEPPELRQAMLSAGWNTENGLVGRWLVRVRKGETGRNWRNRRRKCSLPVASVGVLRRVGVLAQPVRRGWPVGVVWVMG